MLDKVNDKLNRDSATEQLLTSTLDDFNQDVINDEHNLETEMISVDQSFEDYKNKFEESKNIIFPEIVPIGQSVITSAVLMNIVDQKAHIRKGDINLQLLEGLKRSVSDVQTVVAVGPSCRELKVGDLIKIRFSDFNRVKDPNSVNAREVNELPMEVIDGITYLEIHERNAKFIYKKKG